MTGLGGREGSIETRDGVQGLACTRTARAVIDTLALLWETGSGYGYMVIYQSGSQLEADGAKEGFIVM